MNTIEELDETISIELTRSEIDYIKVGLMIDREMTMNAFGRRYMESVSGKRFRGYLSSRYERTLAAIAILTERFERL